MTTLCNQCGRPAEDPSTMKKPFRLNVKLYFCGECRDKVNAELRKAGVKGIAKDDTPR